VTMRPMSESQPNSGIATKATTAESKMALRITLRGSASLHVTAYVLDALPSAAQPIVRDISPEDLDRRLAERGLPLSVFGMDKPTLELEPATASSSSPMETSGQRTRKSISKGGEA
jgi:hypothetical protein